MRHQSRIAEEVEGFLVDFHGSYSDPEALAMTLVRLAVCHYLVPRV